MEKTAAHKLSKHRYKNIDAEHTLSKRGYKNTTMMRPATSSRSKRGVKVISKDSEDHDIGRRLDRGVRTQEFMKKRLDLGLDYSLAQKTVKLFLKKLFCTISYEGFLFRHV